MAFPAGLIVTSSPGGYGGTTQYVVSSIADGTSLQLTAPQRHTLDNGYKFHHWSLGGVSQAEGVLTLSVLMNQARSAQAVYVFQPGVDVVTGEFTLTGQVVGLIYARRMGVSYGGFTLTGLASSLRRGRNLPVGLGGFLASGQGVVLRRALKLIGGTAQFEFTGQSAALLYRPFEMQAGVGAFTLTGQAAQLMLKRVLSGEAGQFEFTGRDAGLARGYRLSAGKSEFELSGLPVNLPVGRGLGALVGEFTLTGNAISFLRTWAMAAETGAFTLTGQTVTLTKETPPSGVDDMLLKTGQTTSYATGDDGDIEAGVARDLTDNGDGTITDNKTKLDWIKQPELIVPGGSAQGTHRGYFDAAFGTYGVGSIVSTSYANWSGDTVHYTAGQYVFNYDAKYRCILTHDSSYDDEPGYGVNWETYWVLVPAFTEWAQDTSYSLGDKRSQYGMWGYAGQCILAHESKRGEPGVDSNWETYWAVVYEYNSGTSYNAGDYVIAEAPNWQLFRAKQSTTGNAPTEGGDAYWEQMTTAGLVTWSGDTHYLLSPPTLIDHNSVQYRCILDHWSTYHGPGDVDGATYWAPAMGAYICNTEHTAASDKEPPNSSYWTWTPWAGAQGTATPATMPWADAIARCNALSYGGHTDWRLPNEREMQSLVLESTNTPAIDGTYFPNTPTTGSYHTATTLNRSTTYAKYVNFQDGNISHVSKTTSYYVRPCRGPVT